MSQYFDWPNSLKRFVRFDAARAEDVNGALDELSAGLDSLDGDVARAIKLPAGTADQTLAFTAGQRANKVLAFDASGNATISANNVDSSGASAAAAALSAGAALLSEGAAAGSAVVASTQAGIAAAQAGNATAHADLAANQVVLASEQVTLAAGQVALATAQAGNAAGSAAAAAVSYSDFDNRWLGVKAVAPTVDNDGGPLQSGALYFHAAAGPNAGMRVRTPSGTWESVADIASSSAAAASAADAAADALRLASLDALWLGPSATDPIAGREGAPLVAGNAYVNTVSGLLRAYNGSAWVQGVSAVAGVTSINGAGGAVTLKTVDGKSLSGAGDISVSSAPAIAVPALDIDCSTGVYFTKTIAGNSTFTFSNPPAAGNAFACALELTHISGTVAWPASVRWPDNTAPTLTAGRTHLFVFTTDDGGARWLGAVNPNYSV